MFWFGHAGITLGAATIGAGLLKSPRTRTRIGSWLDALALRLDIRLLVLGALLPDIIDKPIGRYFFAATFASGRIFAHTLLFLLVLTAWGFFVFRRHRRTGGLALALGTFAHLVLDGMWVQPVTLFWPVLGFTFERTKFYGWWWYFQALCHPAPGLIPELIGLAVLIWFGIVLWRRRKILDFLRHGKTS